MALRPRQWTKNLFVFAALVLTLQLGQPEPTWATTLTFLVFCAISSAVYLVNDLADVEQDRAHPVKRRRPIAAGELSTAAAAVLAAVLGTAGLVVAFRVDLGVGWIALAYLVLQAFYTFWLKHLVIVEVLAIAGGFVLRVWAGGAAIGEPISPYLYLSMIFLAVFQGFAKRRHELVTLDDAAAHRLSLADYSASLLDQMIAVVTASCLTAYAFYTLAPETVEKYRTERLALTIPFVIYGIFRYLYLVHRRDLGGSPTDVLLTDRPLLVAVALWALAMVLIVYTAPGLPVPRAD